MTQPRPVLILGAGINGASVARDLVLNGVPVWIVDRADIASGATAKSSRLIHGGLRYLEYGEFRLVREALLERERLLQNAPDFVTPLRFYVPVRRRWSGWWSALVRLCGGKPSGHAERGLWLVRIGMWMYDRYTRASSLPKRSVHAVADADVPRVDAKSFRWLCAYSDAQMKSPERYTIALLRDAAELAAEQRLDFRVLTYRDVLVNDGVASISDRLEKFDSLHVEPSLVVNATGAWGDLTLKTLRADSPRLFGGNKGSHFVTDNQKLVAALNGRAVYSETTDGRFVFVLPIDRQVLIGTTEIKFDDDPSEAIASGDEVDYLVELVNAVIPDVELSRDDVVCHYSGVRPLPYAPAEASSAVSRDHAIERSRTGTLTTLTLVGGKLTTSRLLAEQTTDMVLAALNRQRSRTTQDRAVVERNASSARVCIEDEWVRTLDDLVERRLLLVPFNRPTVKDLRELATGMVAAGLLADDEATAATDRCVQQLAERYGYRIPAE